MPLMEQKKNKKVMRKEEMQKMQKLVRRMQNKELLLKVQHLKERDEDN